jgi:hypothetical protein
MRPLAFALALPLLVIGCHHEQGQDPQPAPLPNGASLIPVAPAPQPTATPTVEPPSEDPLPAIPGGGGGGGRTTTGCGAPAPPALSRINVRVHTSNSDRVMLDSTPLVGPDVLYCQQIGYTDGRAFCPVRPDGHPERLACEAARIGTAADTGRVGPTWSADGRRCDGTGDPSCVNHSSNQFLVFVSGAGTFRACAAGGLCGELTLP